MKSPTELNFANNLTGILKNAAESGVDVKNVLESMLDKWKTPEESAKVFIAKDNIGKIILFNCTFEYYVKKGKIISVSPQGFIEIEVHNKHEDQISKQTSWFDPKTVYVQEVLEENV